MRLKAKGLARRHRAQETAAYVETSISAQGYDVTTRRATKGTHQIQLSVGLMLHVTHVYACLSGPARCISAFEGRVLSRTFRALFDSRYWHRRRIQETELDQD
jgi:hypothetical protein